MIRSHWDRVKYFEIVRLRINELRTSKFRPHSVNVCRQCLLTENILSCKKYVCMKHTDTVQTALYPSLCDFVLILRTIPWSCVTLRLQQLDTCVQYVNVSMYMMLLKLSVIYAHYAIGDSFITLTINCILHFDFTCKREYTENCSMLFHNAIVGAVCHSKNRLVNNSEWRGHRNFKMSEC